MRSLACVTRWKIRIILLVTLLLASAFAGWSWLRPYAWAPDPAARLNVVGALVQQDHSNYWVDLHLKILPGQTHDLLKPVRFITGTGREIEPADTTMVGDQKRANTDIWFKFWLEHDDLNGPIKLRINDGTLVIKADSAIPDLGAKHSKYFTTQHW